MNTYIHRHAYVYECLVKKRAPARGYERFFYTLLTDITGHDNKQNRLLLEEGYRLALGYMPKRIQYRHDKHATK